MPRTDNEEVPPASLELLVSSTLPKDKEIKQGVPSQGVSFGGLPSAFQGTVTPPPSSSSSSASSSLDDEIVSASTPLNESTMLAVKHKESPLSTTSRTGTTISSTSSQTTRQASFMNSDTQQSEMERPTLPTAMSCIPMFVVDRQGRVCDWNERMVELTGVGFDEGDSDGSFLPKVFSINHFHRLQRLITSSLAGNESCRAVSVKRVTGGSQIVRLNLCSNAVVNSRGERTGVAIIAQKLPNPAPPLTDPDVQSEQATIDIDGEAMSTVDKLIENADVPIIAIDRQGNMRQWNQSAAELFDLDEYDNDLVNANFLTEFQVIPGNDSLSIHEVCGDAFSGVSTQNYDLAVRKGDGDYVHLITTISPWRDNDTEDGTDVIHGALIYAQDISNVMRPSCEIQETANELQSLLQRSNSPIFGVDRMGIVTEWNDKMAEITGYDREEEALGKPFVETFIAPEKREAAENLLAAGLQGRGTTNVEIEIQCKTEETCFLLVTTTTRRRVRVYEGDGNDTSSDEDDILGMIAIAQDVTESAEHDRSVAAMASELRQLIDTANAPIFGIDCDGDVNEWNDKIAEITGYTKEEAFDCSLVETFIVPEMRGIVKELFQVALQGRGASNYELEFLTKSGEIRHLLVNATTRRDAQARVVGVVGVAQDVTEAVQRDKAVAGMALELRQLIDTANAPIFGIDIDGNVNEWNRRTQEITGYSKEETFDEPLVERFIAPSMQHTVQQILDNALKGNETSNYELEFVSKTGEARILVVNATTRRDPEFNVVGVVGVAQDVTDDRKHAAELRKMQYLQAKQEAKVETERNMTAYFAHELRNPLSAIDCALGTMPDNLPTSAKNLVSGMQLCTSFMSSIMNNLLDVRKMEEGKMTLNVAPMSISSLLEGVHKMLLPSVKSGVAFTMTVNVGDKEWALGDEHRIQQVFTNVVTNAIKYTCSGSIDMVISWEGDYVKFECFDSGPGIPKSEQERLFQRFVQRGGAPGTGLGLAIAKHLVDLHGGSIRFDSDPTVKAGTTCIVLLPLKLCDPPEHEEVEEDTAIIDAPIRILIVDDLKMNRMMLSRRLRKGIAPNSSIVEASNGEEALKICGKDHFDVIVVDQYMEEAGGVMVGTDVVYAMRRMRIESIIIGCSGNDLEAEFREAGANWVWKKPMPSNKEIIAQFRQALGNIPSTQDSS